MQNCTDSLVTHQRVNIIVKIVVVDGIIIIIIVVSSS